MPSVVIIYFSGYGHTQRLAEHVAAGAVTVAGTQASLLPISPDGEIDADRWTELGDADAIVFGSPTYMGGPAWQFKRFADASSRPFIRRAWLNKIAGGFTNSSSLNGDKFSTIQYFMTLAMQHGMLWVGTGLLPANAKANSRDDLNFLGGFAGVLGQTPSNASIDEMAPGDLATAEAYGARLATLAQFHTARSSDL